MRPPVIAVLLTSLLAACGGGDDATDAGNAPESTLGGGASPSPEDEVNCTVLRDIDKAGSLIGLQVIPQLTSQSVIDTVKTGSLAIDTDALIDYLEALRPLAGREYPPFGDPDDEIERYITAATAARELLADDGPVPQDQLDAYIALIGDPVEFVGGQAVIGAAIDENCPE
jgi:hypothetical protein